MSPFFRRDELVSRPTTFQRPPTRGNFIQRHHEQQGYHKSAAPVTPSSRVGRPPLNEHQQGLNNPPFHRRQQVGQRALAPPSNHRTYEEPSFRPASMIPQTPRNSQGLLQRPDLRPPSSMYTSDRPHSSFFREPLMQDSGYGVPKVHRSSVAQTPRHMPRTLIRTSRADEQLSQIPGVKGVRAPPALNTYSHPGSVYGAGRGVFSSAGARRSVRR